MSKRCLVVRTRSWHTIGPGSIPGGGTFFFKGYSLVEKSHKINIETTLPKVNTLPWKQCGNSH